MPARPIHTEQGFMNILHQHAKLTACKRAIEQERVEILGHFWDGEMGFWMAKIRSLHGRIWWFKVEVDETQFRYRVTPVSEIPWGNWHGNPNSDHPVHDGHNPSLYYSYRLKGFSEWLEPNTNGSRWAPPDSTSKTNTTSS